MKTHSEKFLQQRKFYMALPVLVLPFITMIFWALGGGEGTPVQAMEIKSGLNLELPGAHFGKGDEQWDKFELYEQAKRDSARFEEAKRNDPYYIVASLKGSEDSDTIPNGNLNTSLGTKDRYAQMEDNEKEINSKIEELNRRLKEPSAQPATVTEKAVARTTPSIQTSSSDIDRLEKMMELMNSDSTVNPEMKQIDNVLDKILEIQNPQRRLAARAGEPEPKVSEIKPSVEDNISVIDNGGELVAIRDSIQSLFMPDSHAVNGFFGLDDELSTAEENENTIQAVIHDTQTIVNGSTIKMRLLNEVTIDGQHIAKDGFVYGVCAINGERLTVTISSIRQDNLLLPVSLKVFDLDGLEGIYIPGAITRDAAKQATSQSIQDVELMSMSNSLELQAATAGVEAAKGLFSRKARLIKITVKAGYQILLKA